MQVDYIARTIGWGQWVMGRLVRRTGYDLLDGLPVLVRNGDVNLMGSIPAPDGDGIPLAGDRLAGEVRGQRLHLFPLCGLLQNGDKITIFFPLTEVVQQSAIPIAHILPLPNSHAVRQYNAERNLVITDKAAKFRVIGGIPFLPCPVFLDCHSFALGVFIVRLLHQPVKFCDRIDFVLLKESVSFAVLTTHKWRCCGYAPV